MSVSYLTDAEKHVARASAETTAKIKGHSLEWKTLNGGPVQRGTCITCKCEVDVLPNGDASGQALTNIHVDRTCKVSAELTAPWKDT